MAILDSNSIDYNLIGEFDLNFLKTSLILPISKSECFINIAICEESLSNKIESFSNLLVKKINVSRSDILFCLDDFEIKQNLYLSSENSLIQKSSFDSKKFLDTLLTYAISKKCSDIHFESENDSFKIKFRIDGEMKTFFSFNKEFSNILSSMIKLISNLDITQKRVPQNARFERAILGKTIDFRVSTMPTIKGESIVLRVLDNSASNKKLNDLNLSEVNLKNIEKNIKKTNGLILVTGPTGSGKTTTLYSILNELNNSKRKIITIEDPVEYQMKGVQQVSINNEIGLKFSEVLKNVLRQDPDVIMIGEIRDKESLHIAIQASLTGHLVFSTLHTNDSISTITRLFDLEAKPYLIATTLRMIIAQRLVLKLCSSCENGCSKCNYTGFEGRVSLFEILEISDEISKIIHKNFDAKEILDSAKKCGFKTLLEDANEKIEAKLTTIDEVYKVIF